MTLFERGGRHAPKRATGPTMLHIFSFVFEAEESFTSAATILIRSRRGHTNLIDPAYDEAHSRGAWPFVFDINTVPTSRLTPMLDRLCRLLTAFPAFLALRTAPAGYRLSIRVDLSGPDGRILANAHDAWQTRCGDRRPASVWPRPDREAHHF